jgi:hypothetical protein
MQDVASRAARAKAAVGVGSLVNRVARQAMALELQREGSRSLAAQARAYKSASDAVNLAADLAIAYSHGPWPDGWPSFEEAAGVEGLPSARTFYRRLNVYRRIFGDDASPYELARQIHADFSARLVEDGPAVAADLPESLLPFA